MASELINEISDFLQKGRAKNVKSLVEEALQQGIEAKEILDNGLLSAMMEVGGKFKRNEVFVPEVLVAARAMNAGLAGLEPYLAKAGNEPLGKAVIGTVKGDMHDIGKNLVAMMLKGAGFEIKEAEIKTGGSMKTVELRVKTEQGEKVLQGQVGDTLLQTLIANGYRVASLCGGKGSCGKCRVQVHGMVPDATAAEKRCFSEEELAEGWRLACKIKLCDAITVSVPEEAEFQILESAVLQNETGCVENEESSLEYDIAVDIGTTTIVLQLLHGKAKRIVGTVSMLNHQRQFGADVVSRIQAAADGKKEELRVTIQRDLKEGIHRLIKQAGITENDISRIVIGANTTMVHLLLGYDCSGLGVYPFTPVSVDLQKMSMQELLGEESGCTAKVVILPGISAFVGGDVVSGLLFCGFEHQKKLALLIDLGTNGEMVLGNRERLVAASTAAGPAFEGGNISCGTGSVEGAISRVKISGGKTETETIGGKEPVGICGSGVVELAAELFTAGYMDETGLLCEEYFESGFLVGRTKEGKEICFTQGDIRELQLAKAAVRAGIEVLLKRFGVTEEQVEIVYVAGGFGYNLNTEKAIAIGMFPESFREKIIAVGNSCIAGIRRYLLAEESETAVLGLKNRAEEINLAMDAEFQNRFIDAMLFEK